MSRLRCPSCGMPTIEDCHEDTKEDELYCNQCEGDMTHTAKHTPGPWKVRTAYSNGEPVCYTIHLGQTSIADVTSLSDQDKVNAHLIAAAPAMYEALQAAHKLLREWTPSGEDNQGEVECLIENALAQAEGREG